MNLRYLVIIATLLAAHLALATEVIKPIPDGSYLGQFQGNRKGKVSMIAKSYAGCQGCFIAVFVVAPGGLFSRNKTPELVVYSAVPRTAMTVKSGENTLKSTNLYDLNPFGVSPEDGKLTLPNADPALTLQIGEGAGTDDVHFTLVQANDVNTLGLTSGMTFDRERESPFQLEEPHAGEYHAYHDSSRFLNIGDITHNIFDNAQSAKIMWSGDNFLNKGGMFTLREQAQSTFSFTRISSLATGDVEAKIPTFITLFFKENGEHMALMVNPHQSVDVRRYDYTRYHVDASLKIENLSLVDLSLPISGTVPTNNLPASWEYPGGPTSLVTKQEVASLAQWAQNVKLEIRDIKRTIEELTTEENRKEIMVKRLEKLANSMDLDQKDLLMRQSLYAGLSLVKILDQASLARGPIATPGTISAEVDVLKHAMDKALAYYISDKAYMEALERQDPMIKYNDRMAEFGSDLASYITDMSVRFRPINLLASYGALHWAIGVLERKIFDDSGARSGLHQVIELMNAKIAQFPSMEEVAKNPEVTDIDLAVSIMKLRRIYVDSHSDVIDFLKDK